ncbi:hypothetical protein HELRODRAFT_159397 [Helobdella robusta]|uniref:Uncharacterized protein n=1 Tax=Helobdella robusta TaxID=6412 RepID=T1EP00_HELRO|nr:hypothetical protein HELRODRAFT_159397 [Helobdella robusta]ESO12812.1 hypothetical protein HELRODRAFT_159397 [Helobdella robusta]
MNLAENTTATLLAYKPHNVHHLFKCCNFHQHRQRHHEDDVGDDDKKDEGDDDDDDDDDDAGYDNAGNRTVKQKSDSKHHSADSTGFYISQFDICYAMDAVNLVDIFIHLQFITCLK